MASAYPKGTSLGQDASFEPSTINIGPGVRPVEVRKKKREGLDGLWFKKIQQRDITRMCQEFPRELIVAKLYTFRLMILM